MIWVGSIFNDLYDYEEGMEVDSTMRTELSQIIKNIEKEGDSLGKGVSSTLIPQELAKVTGENEKGIISEITGTYESYKVSISVPDKSEKDGHRGFVYSSVDNEVNSR